MGKLRALLYIDVVNNGGRAIHITGCKVSLRSKHRSEKIQGKIQGPEMVLPDGTARFSASFEHPYIDSPKAVDYVTIIDARGRQYDSHRLDLPDH